MKTKKKFIFITGGVVSSLGKGLAAASIACLLERRGIKINMIKMDPYINVDPGNMSPFQHGEVFVTDDGAETDLDIGHYERFTSLTLNKKSDFTTGQVYLKVIENERIGKYQGKTVQVVPHITDEIKRRIYEASEGVDLLIGEIGGTVGDIESLPYLEAIRQLSSDEGSGHVLFIHVVLLPFIKAAGELKSKPAQHSVKALHSLGVFPQMIICRSESEVETDILDKISLFCNVPKDCVFKSLDLNTIYRLPISFHSQGLDEKITELLGIWAVSPKLKEFETISYNFDNPLGVVKIGIVGKHADLAEPNKSLIEALFHCALSLQLKLDIRYLESEDILKSADKMQEVDGVLIPGGFNLLGLDGKIAAIKYARENNIPFFGIGQGMQLAVVEFCRNVLKMNDANSEEFNIPGTNVICFSSHGSKRLGSYDCKLQKNSLVHKIYGQIQISERHQHRLEVNNEFVDKLTAAGLVFSGQNTELNLMEVLELKDHSFFIACQYHPEFKSRPHKPHPLFVSFIEKAFKKDNA